jgi:membrane associated rhomboid family serine protease
VNNPLSRLTPLVRLLILSNVAVFVVQKLTADELHTHFALWPLGRYYIRGLGFVGFEPWQIITSAFLHGGVAHIALNMFVLYSFGGMVERVLGTRNFAWLYFASVVAAAATQLIVMTATSGPPVATIGASGGVIGVLLTFALLFPHARVMLLIPPIPMKAWVLVTGYALIELANGVFGTDQGVAHFAHLGGMVGAAVVMMVIGLRSRIQPPDDLGGS